MKLEVTNCDFKMAMGTEDITNCDILEVMPWGRPIGGHPIKGGYYAKTKKANRG
jgi:hypothetical protein